MKKKNKDNLLVGAFVAAYYVTPIVLAILLPHGALIYIAAAWGLLTLRIMMGDHP